MIFKNNDGKRARGDLGEFDSFWDAETLIPQKKPLRNAPFDTSTKDIPLRESAAKSGERISGGKLYGETLSGVGDGSLNGRPTGESGERISGEKLYGETLSGVGDGSAKGRRVEGSGAIPEARGGVASGESGAFPQARGGVETDENRSYASDGAKTASGTDGDFSVTVEKDVDFSVTVEKDVPARYLTFAEISGESRRPRRIREPLPKRVLEEKLVCEYEGRNGLIKKVSVYSWNSKYTFYERFVDDARRYFDIEKENVPYVAFFSYMPVYSHLSEDRLDTYFAFRTKVRRGEYPEVDQSYILLYIYEVINLPDLIPPERALAILCGLWKAYREKYTRLDKLLAEWITDLCLIHGLTFTKELRALVGEDAFLRASLPEFFAETDGVSPFSVLLMGKSAYKWQRSKALTESNREVFAFHIMRAFDRAVNSLCESDGRFKAATEGMRLVKTARDAYAGSICAYNVKRRIDVQYLTLFCGEGLRAVVTDLVKYCENRIRAHFGIRSRLSCPNIGDAEKKAVCGYFDRELPPSERRNAAGNDLDAPDEKHVFSLSLENAKKIERDSWRIADRLTDGIVFEEEEETSAPSTAEEETLDVAKEALLLILDGRDAELKKLADDNFMMTETLIECVNEYCYEFIGDVAVEEKDGKWRVSDDYDGEIREWLKT